MIGAICRFICGPAKGADADQLRSLLRAGSVGVVSARCCAPMSADADEKMLAAANAALRQQGRQGDCLLISITDAQRALPGISAGLAPGEQRLVTQIQSLVASQGFSVFPLLVIDQKIAFYGGLPTADMVLDKLRPAAAFAS